MDKLLNLNLIGGMITPPPMLPSSLCLCITYDAFCTGKSTEYNNCRTSRDGAGPTINLNKMVLMELRN